ncbi:MAG TPA: VWA domain-containing protein [Thermoanaerobaculia bacterium]|nr:VWA domain-containing protein [Thermoanaerobaculia bacterium]
MMKTVRTLALSLLALSLAGPVAAQQEEPQGQFGERIEVNEVLLDVLVTDSRGNVIVGLGKDDFVVKEDGKPVDLTGVTFYSNRRLVEASEAVAQKGIRVDQVPEDRYFILFFEDQKATAQEAPRLLSQQMEAAKRAKGWVDGELLPNDWVAVVSYDTKLKVQQDFTHDRRALVRGIDDAIKAKDPEGNYPSRITAEGPSLLKGLPKGKELRKETGTIFDALRLISEATGNIRGRKNLLLFTYGLPGRTDSFGQFVPDKVYFEPTVRALNDNNVAAYTVDITPPGTEHTLSDSLNSMAVETGGRYFFNVTNFSTPLDQISQENSGYYLLSYQTERLAGAKGFQPVQVTTTNPEFRVKARRGYGYGD